jgi:trk system potassium uptake protein TrkH
MTQTPRQLRRQQQRTAAAQPKSDLPESSATISPIVPPPESLGPGVLVPAFCAVIVLGCLLYHVPGLATHKGNELTWPQPLFTAVNAATLTGFQQAHNPDFYTSRGQIVTFLLTLAGILFSFIGGGVAVIRIARLRFKDWHLIILAIASVLFVGVVGGASLICPGRDFWQAGFQAVSAFGNSGLTLGRLPSSSSAQALLVLLPLVVLGGLGLPVLMEIFDLLWRWKPLSKHSRTVLTWTAVTYLALSASLAVVQASDGSKSLWSWAGNLPSCVADSSVQAINARSAGFGFLSISRLPQATTLILIGVMVIGASPGGTAGGVKVTTLATIATGTRDCLARRAPGRPFGTALIWLGVYLALLLASTVALLMTDPEIHLDRTLFLAASALGNVGLSHNPIDASNGGIYVLCLTMLIGRIAPLLMLWYLIDTTPEAEVAM